MVRENVKGPFINYARVPREGGLEKSLVPLLWGDGGQNHSYVIFSKSIFYIRNRAVSGLAGIIIHLRLDGKKVLG